MLLLLQSIKSSGLKFEIANGSLNGSVGKGKHENEKATGQEDSLVTVPLGNIRVTKLLVHPIKVRIANSR